ncbi:maiA [Symbiodinium sp. KB8]|nr:maiA [Symbiodinium sp. KB8]
MSWLAERTALPQRRPGPNLAEANLGECDICKKVMEAIRDVKTLPCKHRFHFDCIDGFHRRKLREEGDVNLPCFTCGAASHKSIASVVAERHRQKEQAADDRRREEERQAQAAQGHSKVNRRGALAALAQAALMEQKWAMWMVSPTSKKGSATLLRRNDWRQLLGPLTGEEVRIPDVNSGYPKGVYPTKWEDGQCQPVSVETFDLGGGFPDQNEFVMKFGVIIPSTNTTVEYDFWSMIMQNRDVCKGIGFHMSGILIDSPKLATDEDMLHFLQLFRKQIFTTVDRLMTSEPQYIIMGMSLETFFGGWEGNKEFKKELSDRTGLNIATGAEACKASLEKFGAKRITVITPYQDIGDRNVVKFFSEIGIEVVRIAGLKCGSATDIAHVPEAWCEKVVRENLLLPDIDAVVQCGTNLSFVNLADRLEREVGIPIVAINVACLWFAMREVGIDAKLQGCTRLFREH